MGQIKILTESGIADSCIPTTGTQVYVDGIALEKVLNISLVAEPASFWKLTVELAVDPNLLFGKLEKAE